VAKKIKVELVRSPIGREESHKRTVAALGLKKINSKAVHNATPQIQGMIRKVGYLLRVEEVSE